MSAAGAATDRVSNAAGRKAGADGVGLKRLHLTVFVFGDKYVRLFARIVLPNLLGLIEEIPEDVRAGTRFRVLTDPPSAAIIAAAPAHAEIRALVPVDIAEDMQKAGYETYGGYGPMILGQARLVHEASLEGAGIIFCPPDLVWSTGSFAAIVEMVRKGARAVIGPSARGIEEDLVPIFASKIEADAGHRLRVPSPELTRLLYANWQQMNDGFVWNGPPSNFWKSYAYWRVGPRQYIMKCWQGPALFLWPFKEVEDYDGWIDHRLIKSCARRQSEVFVVRDAMSVQTIDLAPRDRGEGHRLTAAKRWALFKQLLNRKRHCRLNILYGRENIRIYDEPLPEATWLEAERAFDSETLPAMYAAIALRPVLAIIDGIYRHSGLAATVHFVRRQLRKFTVMRDIVNLARQRQLGLRSLGRVLLQQAVRLVGRLVSLPLLWPIVWVVRKLGLKPRTRLLQLRAWLRGEKFERH